MNQVLRLSFGKNCSRLINLKNISSVYHYDNKISLTYNYCTSDGLLILGSGFFNKNPHSEIIHFDNNEDACKTFNEIDMIIKKEK
jgi:hypothetical protein